MNPQFADLIGEKVGHIRIIDVLGQGGMGTVYLGEDEKLRRKVAVKAIRGEHRLHPNAKSRFLQEARILSQMNHRNICAVYEFIEHEDSDFLVFEMVEGRNLRAAMKTQLSRQKKLDRPNDAEAYYQRTLSIFSESLPPGHPRLTATTTDFAAFLREQGREAEAAELEAGLPPAGS